MSYNILADRLSALPKFVAYVPEMVRDFKFRSTRVIGEIAKANCGIVCLQEVDYYDEFYRDRLAEKGYQVLFRPKPSVEFA